MNRKKIKVMFESMINDVEYIKKLTYLTNINKF